MCCNSSLVAGVRAWFAVVSLFAPLLGTATVRGAAQGFAVGSLDLGLDNQPGWFVWYNATDSPETAYLATIHENEESVSGIVQLGRTLAPGHYYIAAKVIDYNAGGTLDFNIGGGLATTPLDSHDFNGQWTLPVAIDVATASTTLQITLHRSNPPGTRQIFLFRGIYITPQQGEIVFADDSILNPQYPTQLDPTPAHKGNILENSGFEVGTGHGWGLGEATPRSFSVASLWDNTVSFEGAASIKLPTSAELVSRIYRLRGNRQFTLSAWVKTASAGSVTLIIQNGSGGLPTNFPSAVYLSQSFSVNSSWQRVSLSGVLLDYPRSDYYIRIRVSDPVGGYTWVDGVQLEEAGLTDYASGQNPEVGLVSGQPSNLFYEDESATMQLFVRNSGASSAPATVPYEIYDYLNRRVAAGSTNVVVPAHGRWVGNLNLSTGQRGIFRVVLWVQGVEHTREEVVYGIVPRSQQAGLDTDSLIGIHTSFTEFQSSAVGKLGVKWNRASSPSKPFRWAAIEPSEGVFQWTAEDLTLATSHGVSVLGTLGLDWPAWADVGGLPDLTKWEAFVQGVVAHYKDQVKYWEIWNEPQYQFTPSFYAQLLQRGVTAIRAVDPQAKIVGLGGVADVGWCTNALNSLPNNWLSNLDAVSTHLYPKFNYQGYTDFRNYVRDRYGVPVWNTEAGVWDRGFYLAENSGFIQTDYAWEQKAAERYDFGHRGAPELITYAFLNNIGNGLSKFFYYDGRIYLSPAYAISHATIFEYDDSIRAKGVVFAVLARLFDHSTGLGSISPDPNSLMFLFNRGGVPLVGLWSPDGVNRSLTISLNASSYKVYDLMGNTLNIVNGTIPYGAAPVYVEGQGIAVATLQGAVQGGTVAARADTTPPNLSLVVFPTGPTHDNPVKFRWIAVDDTSNNSLENNLETQVHQLIQYSYYLQGSDAGWSGWSPKTFVDYSQLSVGSYDFQVRARDAAGNISVTNHFALIVGQPPPGPVLASISDRTIDELTLLTVNASASDPDPNQTLTFAMVSAPSGVNLNASTGVLTWTPTEAQGPGTYSITLRVFENAPPSLSATQTFTVFVNEVSDVNSPPTLAPHNPENVNEQTLLTVINSASDPDPGQTLTFALVSGPSGVNLDASTGVLTWTPTEAQGPGAYPITLRVSDNGSPSLSATQSFTVFVSELNSAPTLAPIGDQTVNESTLLTVNNSATDPDIPAQDLSFALVSAPPGVDINPATGLLTWTPTPGQGPGSYVITLRVFDNGVPSMSATQSFTVFVTEPTEILPLSFVAGAAFVSSGAFHVPVTGGTNQGSIVIDYSNGSPSPYVSSMTLGTLRNNYSGFVGMKVIVGSNPITVTELGRIFVAGNVGTHVVKLVNAASGADVAGASVSVTMTGGTPGQFKYTALNSPIVLSGGGNYYLVSEETTGGDFWYDYNSTVTTAPVATDLTAIYGSGGAVWNPIGLAGQTFGPVDFKYQNPLLQWTWIPLYTNNASGSTFEFSDPTIGRVPIRFYRARQQP
jgi:hypothetical protein